MYGTRRSRLLVYKLSYQQGGRSRHSFYRESSISAWHTYRSQRRASITHLKPLRSWRAARAASPQVHAFVVARVCVVCPQEVSDTNYTLCVYYDMYCVYHPTI